MVSKVLTCNFQGLNCQLIEVESFVSQGLPSFHIVGMGDTAIKESRERVKAAIKNSGFKYPQNKKTVNLAPAQVRKHGSLFDLPIALAILLSSKQISDTRLKGSIILGELSLDGNTKAVAGVLPITKFAKSKGIKRIFLPEKNAREAAFIPGIDVIPIKSLSELCSFCNFASVIEPHKKLTTKDIPHEEIPDLLGQIAGQKRAKRALQIVAAGHHNILLYGNPGCGKTMLCRALHSLLTPMTSDEALETAAIYSVANQDSSLTLQRPFREVHHTIPPTALIGGGSYIPYPGEISLAHNGVLFLDEIAEFKRETLETLRQPLEDGEITLSRQNISLKYPASLILVASMNPCPCGYEGDKKINCHCSAAQIRHYQTRLSGPLLDRFDLALKISKVNLSSAITAKAHPAPSLNPLRVATHIQRIRFAKHPKIKKNSQMQLEDIKKYCPMTKEASAFFHKTIQNSSLSNRSYLKLIKVARTIADLANHRTIQLNHIAEAFTYRKDRTS